MTAPTRPITLTGWQSDREEVTLGPPHGPLPTHGAEPCPAQGWFVNPGLPALTRSGLLRGSQADGRGFPPFGERGRHQEGGEPRGRGLDPGEGVLFARGGRERERVREGRTNKSLLVTPTPTPTPPPPPTAPTCYGTTVLRYSSGGRWAGGRTSRDGPCAVSVFCLCPWRPSRPPVGGEGKGRGGTDRLDGRAREGKSPLGGDGGGGGDGRAGGTLDAAGAAEG